jgi:hypothetical protein
MDLTPDVQKQIDGMDHYQVLESIRFLPVGHPLMAGASGDYLFLRMIKLKSEPGGEARHVAASKAIGWEPR